jgi:2-oxo-4-hydroxy-4-carboxy-5-ureidoimidazoline decarboxylase
VPAARAEAALLACCGSARWAARLAAHRPYPDLGALLAAADEAAYDMSGDDLAEALAAETAREPGTAPEGPAMAAAHPASPPPRSSLAAWTALQAAHAAYEAKFGHVFVAAPVPGHSPEEELNHTLAALHARLGHDAERERAVAARELRLLAATRLTRLAAAGPGTYGTLA